MTTEAIICEDPSLWVRRTEVRPFCVVPLEGFSLFPTDFRGPVETKATNRDRLRRGSSQRSPLL
jgi:hypothetical protein